MKQKEKKLKRDQLKPKHDEFLTHLENIKRHVKGDIVEIEDLSKVVAML
jgi:hypothetical protein